MSSNDLDTRIEQCCKDIEKLEETRRELIKKKKEQLTGFVSFGEFFRIIDSLGSKHYYQLIYTVANKDGLTYVALISPMGTRWNYDIYVENPFKIPMTEFVKLVGDYQFEKISRETYVKEAKL